MPENMTVSLGGTDYVVPPLDVGQYEQLDAHWASKPEGFTATIGMAEIVLATAEPKIEDVRRLKCTPLVLQRACNEIMRLSGLEPGASAGEGLAAEVPASIS